MTVSFFSRAHYPTHLSEALMESMGETNNQVWVYMKQNVNYPCHISTLTASLF